MDLVDLRAILNLGGSQLSGNPIRIKPDPKLEEDNDEAVFQKVLVNIAYPE